MRVTGRLSLKVSSSLVHAPSINSAPLPNVTPRQLPNPKEPPLILPPVCAVIPSESPVLSPQKLPSSPPDTILARSNLQDYHVPSIRTLPATSTAVPAARPYYDKTPDVSSGFNFVDVLQAMRAPPLVQVDSKNDAKISEPFANISASCKDDELLNSSSRLPKDPRIDKLANYHKQVDEVSSSTELQQKVAAGAIRLEVDGNAETDILMQLSAIADFPPPPRRRRNPEVSVRHRIDGGRRRDDVRRKRSPSPNRSTRRLSNPEVVRDDRRVFTTQDRQAEEPGEFRPVKRARNMGERPIFAVRTKLTVSSTGNAETGLKQASQDPNEVWRHEGDAEDDDNPGTKLYKLGSRHYK